MIDLERLAREADLATRWCADEWACNHPDGNVRPYVERFAQLVAEEAAKIAEGELEPGSVECAAAIRKAFGIARDGAQ